MIGFMDKVRISIIIPVYNAGKYLDGCLKAIREQKMTSYEVILVNDGSTDDSPAICDRYASEDRRFSVIHKENAGVSSARNAGLAAASGDYVMFVDSDDMLSADALERVCAAAENDPDFVVGGFEILDDDVLSGEVRPLSSGFFPSDRLPDFFDSTMLSCGELYRSPWAKLYRLSLIRHHSITFADHLSYGEDKLFVYQYLSHISSAASVNVPVYRYFRRADTLSGGRTTERRLSQLLDAVPLYAEAFLRLLDVHPDCGPLRRVFHNEIVCNDILRIFRTFLKISTDLLTEQVVAQLYRFMDKDKEIRLCERRVPGQLINMFAYRCGNPALSYRFYRFVSSVLDIFYR